MRKIKIKDLPKDHKISKEEMKRVTGGGIFMKTAWVFESVRRAQEVHPVARSQKQLLDSILGDVGTDIADREVPL